MSDLFAAAIFYAKLGWPVFLLTSTKVPMRNCPKCRPPAPAHDPEACAHLTCHGFYAATVDPYRIDAMFRVAVKPMLAMRTGETSGTVVVDVDHGNGGDVTLAELVAKGLTPPTAYVRTGSGGLHLYYRHPGVYVPISQSRLGPGIDVRGDGGYVVAPPSIHPKTGELYRWERREPVQEMPAALIEACQPPAAPPLPVAGQVQTTGGGGISNPDRLLETLLDRVRTAPEGTRRTTLYGCARGVAKMVAAGAIRSADAVAALTDAGRIAEQTEREIRAAIAGGFRDEGVIA